MTEKSREESLREKLRRRGYALRKARGRQHSHNLGEYMIVQVDGNLCVRGENFDCSLGEVEDFIRAPKH